MEVLQPDHTICLVDTLPTSLVSLEAPLAFAKWTKFEDFFVVGFLFRLASPGIAGQKPHPPGGFPGDLL